jgi:diaminopimelate epimerase
MSIPFCKFHGFGNDYIVIERDAIADGPIDLAELGSSICHRNTGAGADGIAVLHKLESADADYFCEIINPDGSTAGFSGNGTRCAAAYLHRQGLWTGTRLKLQTRSGIKNYDLLERKGNDEFWFEAEIGKPKFGSESVPFASPEPLEAVVNAHISSAGQEHIVSAVNVGNPVACVIVENFDPLWRNIGRTLETHDSFPEKANIVFVRVSDDENIEIRIWERGVGETSSSGTCCSGAAVLSAFMLRTGRKVSVHTQGGITEVNWRDDDEIVLTGKANFIYCGVWPV